MASEHEKGDQEAFSFLKLWATNSVWGAAWSAAFTLCVGVFGDTIALVTIAFLTVAITTVWYATGKRGTNAGEG